MTDLAWARPSLDLMPVPPRWQLSCPAGMTVPPHSRMARRHPGQESTGHDQRPRRQPRKARFSSGLVHSHLLSCSRHKSEASGLTGHASRQVDNLTRHANDLAGDGRKGLRGSSTGSRPTSICSNAEANRFRVDPLSLPNVPYNVCLQRVFVELPRVEPPRGFDPGPTYYKPFARPLRTGSYSCILRPTPTYSAIPAPCSGA